MKGIQLLKFFVFILRSKFSKNVFVFCLRKISRVFEFPIERFERSKVSKAPSTFHGCAKKKETKLFCLKYAEIGKNQNVSNENELTSCSLDGECSIERFIIFNVINVL